MVQLDWHLIPVSSWTTTFSWYRLRDTGLMLSKGEFRRNWFWRQTLHFLFHLCIHLPQVLPFGSTDAVCCGVSCKSDLGGNLDENNSLGGLFVNWFDSVFSSTATDYGFKIQNIWLLNCSHMTCFQNDTSICATSPYAGVGNWSDFRKKK